MNALAVLILLASSADALSRRVRRSDIPPMPALPSIADPEPEATHGP